MKKLIIFIFLGLILTACFNNKYDFNLKGAGDKTYTLKDFKGDNLLIYFGYTLCADICPTSLAIATKALNELNRNDIKILFISLDPKRDTANDINEYVQYFYKNSLGLVPSEDELKRISKNYGVKYEYIYQDSAAEYTVAHSSSFYIIDKDGNFKGEISNLTNANVKKKISEFLGNN
ncbi:MULTISPECIES: SCO family protein [unclassified Campylobacter]|uniref:SCO family protein n=1 Tax=unclassified Campylobacter TaxID=2593542 RepID=UPI001BDA5D56|nr:MULTISPECIES: SCO family protein [unclassified Campylobacter]MBZ7976240.1 SCO family protein [Campylobacter sp. RM12637]MBZ7979684.1 SCO family protein [Campylobacter sp. RM12642]MBZ7981613.1 SCO family protein [Campylobacter sp. RM12640]MBZ7984309.1 SCO family protein [Campylobacter sp. RM12647]MBZ7988412.1 SCO family protein [Campylobacter sp. RM12635]MBZ7991452.1 SCO family protein [Campylobacter sp. RM9331]MBZ7993607.1 SCO family protein [Campylobacter sp. RM9333]MBZ8005496.1 SCO fam